MLEKTEKCIQSGDTSKEKQKAERDSLFSLVKARFQDNQYLSCVVPLAARIMDALDDSEQKAFVAFGMGTLMETRRKFKDAVTWYSQASLLESESLDIAYYSNNNLGYCLNVIERFNEAESWCCKAIEIDPQRHNAYKNLGMSLQGQGRYPEAAKCFIKACILCPLDARALYYLEQLAAGNHGIANEIEDIEDQLKFCRWIVKGEA
ncbi:MAG TPA: tetratricopeptide repeat protein [Syntrophorhabdus sp.]|nr:tetratricopeptide repeat protein [Syntrophorhabdus sp.]HOQ42822.1 tetratricopeptide repeat protein [Smithellaceae bacterium]